MDFRQREIRQALHLSKKWCCHFYTGAYGDGIH